MRALAAFALAGCTTGFTVEGEHHGYVISKLELPMTEADGARYGRDVNGDGRPDNLFARVFTSLATAGAVIEDGNDFELARGKVLLLVDLQARDLGTAAAAAVKIVEGRDPTPTPCSSSSMCGQHLKGTGHFDVAFAYPEVEAIPGTIRSGAFASVTGELELRLAVRDLPQPLPLIGARVELTKIADDAIEGVISGGVVRDKAIDLGKQLLSDLKLSDLECDIDGAPPDCSCETPISLALTRRYDTDRNCLLTTDELTALEPLFAPLDATDLSLSGTAAASIGLGFRAVAATFDP